jgi:hypothetical protein
MRADSSQLKAAGRALEARVEGKLLDMGRLEERVDAKLALTVGLEGQVGG